MVMAAVAAPAVVGAKWPWMVQLAPTARLVPQELAKTNCDAFVPVTATLVIDKAAAPLLVNVTVWDSLVSPTVIDPKATLVDDSVTGAGMPVPVRAMV